MHHVTINHVIHVCFNPDQQREVDTVSPNDYLLLHNRTLKEMEGAIGSQGRIKVQEHTLSQLHSSSPTFS